MEYVGVIVNGILTTLVFVAIFFGVYKVYQIATDIREMKDMVLGARGVSAGATPLAAVRAPALVPEIPKGLTDEDSATAYAEHLLRAVNTESQRAENAPHQVR